MQKLKYTKGRIIVQVDMQSKNSHRFADGTTIRLERGYENFNRRETEPTNAIVVSAEDVPSGVEILIHHNSLHEVNLINDYTPLGGLKDEIRYYSIPEAECFAWRDESGQLQPMKNFAFAMRVFEPYKGMLQGIEPTLVKDVLYIYTGELKGNVCHVLKAADYTIIYQGTSGREEQVVRLRHSEDETFDREEVIAIANDLTEKLNNGELLIGLSPSTAKPLKNTTAYAN